RSSTGGEGFVDEAGDRLVDPTAGNLEEVVVVGLIDPERGDGPRGGGGQAPAHVEGDDPVEPAVTDQDRAIDPADLAEGLEPVPQQEGDGNDGQERAGHVDGTGECAEDDESPHPPAGREVDGDGSAQRPAAGHDPPGFDAAAGDQLVVSRIGR